MRARTECVSWFPWCTLYHVQGEPSTEHLSVRVSHRLLKELDEEAKRRGE